jgi:hypothetical protein
MKLSEGMRSKRKRNKQMRKLTAKNLHAGKPLGWAGATPLLCAQSRPKGLWGHSRPSPRNGDRVLPACIQRCNQPRMQRIKDLE